MNDDRSKLLRKTEDVYLFRSRPNAFLEDKLQQNKNYWANYRCKQNVMACVKQEVR